MKGKNKFLLIMAILMLSHPANARRIKNNNFTIRHNAIVINGFTSVVDADAQNSNGKRAGNSKLILAAYPQAKAIARIILEVKDGFYGQGVGDGLFFIITEEARKTGVRHVVFDFPYPYCVNPQYVYDFLERQEERGLIKNIIYVPSDVFIPKVTPPNRYAIFEIVYLDQSLEDDSINETITAYDIATPEDILMHLANGGAIQTLDRVIPEDKIRIIGELPSNRLTNSDGFIASSRKPIDALEFSEFMAKLNYTGTDSSEREAGDVAIYRDSTGSVMFKGLFIDGDWVRGLWLDKFVIECHKDYLPSDWTSERVIYYRRIR